jgi:hypothetical protein
VFCFTSSQLTLIDQPLLSRLFTSTIFLVEMRGKKTREEVERQSLDTEHAHYRSHLLGLLLYRWYLVVGAQPAQTLG